MKRLASHINRVALISAVIAIVGVINVTRTGTGAAQQPEATNTQVTLTYLIVDTGQVKCYNASSEIACPAAGAAFYGQDTQFTGHAPSYTNNNDGTVTDNVTGLMWQRSADLNSDGNISATDKLTWSAAITYCNNLSLAGYIDWRLPDIKTLYSLIKFNGSDPSGFNGTDTSSLTPFIDTAYFAFAYGDSSAGERIIDAQYASSTHYVTTTMNGDETAFGVNFADGRIKGYGLVMPGGATKSFFVQCVRGNTSYGVNAFADNGDGTVTDSATGLMWSQADSGTGMDWQSALAWVQTKNAQNFLGHNDWRLPDAKEMQSILDYTRSPATSNSAAIDPIFTATSFTNEGGQTDWPWYWASTTHASSNGIGASGVYIAFGRASGWQKVPQTATCYTLLDVHGAGAQRSDPKISANRSTIGTACNGATAYGLGPQGDLQRGANYVRLVRNATQPAPILTGTYTASSATPRVRDHITYTLVVTNSGAAAANGVNVTATIPGGTQFITATGYSSIVTGDRMRAAATLPGYVTWAGSLSAGQAHTLSMQVQVVTTGALTSMATFGADAGTVVALPAAVTAESIRVFVPIIVK
jgi:uncharacterized repeat protein (TIGR01451 family)